MKLPAPTHTTKRQIKNMDGSYFWTKTTEFWGWLGSGVFDKYGKEIFEGDIVKKCTSESYPELNTKIYIVIFRWGEFIFISPHDWEDRDTCGGQNVGYSSGKCLEVIGHIADEKFNMEDIPC